MSKQKIDLRGILRNLHNWKTNSICFNLVPIFFSALPLEPGYEVAFAYLFTNIRNHDLVSFFLFLNCQLLRAKFTLSSFVRFGLLASVRSNLTHSRCIYGLQSRHKFRTALSLASNTVRWTWITVFAKEVCWSTHQSDSFKPRKLGDFLLLVVTVIWGVTHRFDSHSMTYKNTKSIVVYTKHWKTKNLLYYIVYNK